MSAEAIAKLKVEMDGNKDNSYIHYVGLFLMNHIASHPEDAGKILADGKTVAKSLDAMRSVAEKKRKGNVAMLTPAEGLTVVFEYFEIKKQIAVADFMPAVAPTAAPIAAPTAAPAPKPASDFDVSLDAYL